MSKIFIDTNILVYSMDKYDLSKQEESRQLLVNLTSQHEGVISTQVLQEFYVTSTTKLQVDPVITKQLLKTFEHFEIVLIDKDIIQNAADIQIHTKISFWDALIVSAAQHACCEHLWTEDLNHGQVFGDVTVINPYIRI